MVMSPDYSSPNSILNFRKSYQYLEKNWLKDKNVTGKNKFGLKSKSGDK